MCGRGIQASGLPSKSNNQKVRTCTVWLPIVGRMVGPLVLLKRRKTIHTVIHWLPVLQCKCYWNLFEMFQVRLVSPPSPQTRGPQISLFNRGSESIPAQNHRARAQQQRQQRRRQQRQQQQQRRHDSQTHAVRGGEPRAHSQRGTQSGRHSRGNGISKTI